ncbi:MAG: hypothetical protein F6K58_13715 [Symploca sp. SIO2E9]|nr:hypothetical protein [Symploca sp. SIO2E9]
MGRWADDGKQESLGREFFMFSNEVRASILQSLITLSASQRVVIPLPKAAAQRYICNPYLRSSSQ